MCGHNTMFHGLDTNCYIIWLCAYKCTGPPLSKSFSFAIFCIPDYFKSRMFSKSPSKAFDHQSVSTSENCTIGFPHPVYRISHHISWFPDPLWKIFHPPVSIFREGTQSASSQILNRKIFVHFVRRKQILEQEQKALPTNQADKRASVRGEGWLLLWCLVHSHPITPICHTF